MEDKETSLDQSSQISSETRQILETNTDGANLCNLEELHLQSSKGNHEFVRNTSLDTLPNKANPSIWGKWNINMLGERNPQPCFEMLTCAVAILELTCTAEHILTAAHNR